MAAPAGAPRGISLRWKIVIGMAGITVATAILIFFVVYSKAVGQLSDEIDAKGIRLVRTLASIDPQYWMLAIYQSQEDRKERMDWLLQRLFEPVWHDEAKGNVLHKSPELRKLYDQITHAAGPDNGDVAATLIARFHESLAADLQTDAHRQALRTHYDGKLKEERWLTEWQKLVNPLGSSLRPLKGDRSDVGPGSDILQISVLDITTSDGQSVQAVEGQGEKGIAKYGSNRPRVAGVEIGDGRDKSSGVEVRLFKLEQDHGPVGKLRYSVLLSLTRIDEAKSSLRTSIFLPVFVSVLLGLGIAIWLSTLFTEPIKQLMRDIQAVSAGDLDHQTVPISRDEVGLLASSFNRMTGALREAHAQEVEAKSLEHDLAIASEIQSNLVPKRMLRIPGYDISAYYRPSKEVGGDYYDFIAIDDDNEAIVVAAVSGKGVSGSLVMSMARAFIRMEAERSRNTSPSDTLIRANRMLAQDIKKGMFVTAMYSILNKRTNEVRVASAGHNPLVVWRAATKEVQLVNPGGIALGFDKGPVFERTIKEERIALNHGDRLVLYTDGVVEAMDAAHREFGDPRFHKLIQELATRDSNQMLNLVIKTLDEYRGAAPQSDDITVVTLRYL